MSTRVFELIAPCHFGMEAMLKREIYDLGYDVTRVEDGRVTFAGDAEAIARANIFLRSAERVLLCLARFQAQSFEELFQGIRAVAWEDFIPEDGRFWVKKASTAGSRLFSSSDIQSIVKKAIVERLKQHYHREWFAEDGEEFPLRVFIYKDEVTAALDTTGESLHKRGYRKMTPRAPISETLAAAMLMLTPWHRDRILVDPFCGSGTFPIEAAMMGANIAPGINRTFTAQKWAHIVPARDWSGTYEEARDLVTPDLNMDIQGYDIDAEAVSFARANARLAGVDGMVHFQQRPVSELSHPKKYGFIVTNPPYGERMEEKAALPRIYQELGEAYSRLDSWSCYIITSYEDVERCFGRRADKNRKIYNGMIRAYIYQFLGPKPPKSRR